MPYPWQKAYSMEKVLVIDNYDSFTYNLVHYLEELGCEVIVRRNDQITLSEAQAFDYMLLSPGPGIPEESGLLKDLIQNARTNTRILGVCLGMQAIGEVYGGRLINLDKVYHGIASPVTLTEKDQLFDGIPETFDAGRYHSWVVDAELPEQLQPLAYDENGQLMALKHKERPVWGVQFHPESVLTPVGKTILKNWIAL